MMRQSGNYALVDTLVCRGADTTVTDQYGNTLLHSAAAKGNTNVVERLLFAQYVWVKQSMLRRAGCLQMRKTLREELRCMWLRLLDSLE